MGKKGKKARAGKLTRKEIINQLDVLEKKIEKEIKNADLFAPLPPTDICPICLLSLSRIDQLSSYHVCCGNKICKACLKESDAFVKIQNEKNAEKKKKASISPSCPFCREPRPSFKDFVRQLEARASQNDANALFYMGRYFMKGGMPIPYTSCRIPKDELKALTYLIRSVELGSSSASELIAIFLTMSAKSFGDNKRADLFYLFSAVKGNVASRHIAGEIAYYAGNHEEGIRHWKLAAEGGFQSSINKLKSIFLAGGEKPGKEFITKECLDRAFRICHEAQKEVGSDERKKLDDLDGLLAHMYRC